MRKIMMRKIILALGLALNGILGYTQEARALLDKASEKMNAYTSVFSTFDYRLDNDKESIHDIQKGNIYLEGEKYHLELSGMVQIYDGEKIYTISDEDQEVTISKKDNTDALLTPVKILNAYKKGYKITAGNKKGDIKYVILTPEKKSTTKKVVIGINSKTINLQSVMEENNEGTQTTLILTKFIPNAPVLPMQLQYDKNKYKNYIITEMD